MLIKDYLKRFKDYKWNKRLVQNLGPLSPVNFP